MTIVFFFTNHIYFLSICPFSSLLHYLCNLNCIYILFACFDSYLSCRGHAEPAWVMLFCLVYVASRFPWFIHAFWSLNYHNCSHSFQCSQTFLLKFLGIHSHSLRRNMDRKASKSAWRFEAPRWALASSVTTKTVHISITSHELMMVISNPTFFPVYS